MMMMFSRVVMSSSAETQYAPLTPALVKTLTDKLYEKRKTAALNIET